MPRDTGYDPFIGKHDDEPVEEDNAEVLGMVSFAKDEACGACWKSFYITMLILMVVAVAFLLTLVGGVIESKFLLASSRLTYESLDRMRCSREYSLDDCRGGASDFLNRGLHRNKLATDLGRGVT